MRLILASVTFWLFVVWSCFILGAGVYEALVVEPFWAGAAPTSLMASNPLLVVPERAGMVFWSTVTPGLGLVALAALLTSFGTPRPHMTWRIASTGLALFTILVTAVYFVPTIIKMVAHHGGGLPDDVVVAEVKRWVVLNWFRVAAMVVSIGMGIRALLLPMS